MTEGFQAAPAASCLSALADKVCVELCSSCAMILRANELLECGACPSPSLSPPAPPGGRDSSSQRCALKRKAFLPTLPGGTGSPSQSCALEGEPPKANAPLKLGPPKGLRMAYQRTVRRILFREIVHHSIVGSPDLSPIGRGARGERGFPPLALCQG